MSGAETSQATDAVSIVVERLLTGTVPELSNRLHETVVAAALSFIAAQCATRARTESLRRATA